MNHGDSTTLRCVCTSVGALGAMRALQRARSGPRSWSRAPAAPISLRRHLSHSILERLWCVNAARQRHGHPGRSRHAPGCPRSCATSGCSCAPCPRPSIYRDLLHRVRERHPVGDTQPQWPWTAIARRAPVRGCFARARAFRSSSGSIRPAACRTTDNARRGNVIHIHPEPTARFRTDGLGACDVADIISKDGRNSGPLIVCSEYCVIFTGRSRVFVEHELYKTTYQRLAACRECRTSFAHLADMKQEDLPYLHRKVSES